MIKLLTRVSVLILCLVTPVLAHGGRSHVMGTVTSINTHSMTVTKQDGVSLSIRLSPTTAFRAVSGEKTDARPAVGSRVIVDVTETHESVDATEVRFSSAHAESAPHVHAGQESADRNPEASGHSHSHHGGQAMPLGPHQD